MSYVMKAARVGARSRRHIAPGGALPTTRDANRHRVVLARCKQHRACSRMNLPNHSVGPCEGQRNRLGSRPVDAKTPEREVLKPRNAPGGTVKVEGGMSNPGRRSRRHATLREL